ATYPGIDPSMSMLRRLMLAGSLVLVACQAPVTVVKPAPKASKAVAVEATSRPASPSPAAAAPVSLQAPTSAFVALAGTVTVDAAYLLGTAQTSLVGSGAVAVGDAKLLANNSGNLVATTQGGAALAVADGSFLAAGNAGILSNNGSGVIANNGSGIVSDHGGGIVSDHGAGRRLLAVPAAGTQLPAGGLVVSAVSLRTQQYVPVGTGAGGEPAYGVYSDAAGGYKLYVPASEQGNVAVVASVPGNSDAKLVYNTIVPVAANSSAAVDDDAAVTTRMIRRTIAGQIALIMVTADNAINVSAITEDNTVPAAFQPGLVRAVTALNQRARARGVPTGPAALDQPEVQALAQRLADVVLGFVPYDDVKLDPLLAPGWKGPQDKLFVAMGKTFKHLREATRTYMQAKLAAGGTLPVTMSVMVARQAPGALDDCRFEDPVALGTPADLGVFLVEDLLSRYQTNAFFNTAAAFQATRLPGGEDPDIFFDDAHQPFQESERLRASSSVLFAYFALTLAPPDATDEAPAPALAQLLTTLDAFAASHTFTAPPHPRPQLGLGVPCSPPPKSK
ncbi:MAG: hypothetical protein JWM80_2321, partial [Cyanobacteria bacterium RYN_339]|nr:hypothetical protein [Cyanobacteria bacterium RYN_339]